MTDRNKFEEMLERLVNEDRAGAEELFHEIVVERSREIYQSIIEAEEEEEVDEASEEDDEELEESADEDEEVDEAADEDEDLDEMFGLDEFELEADPMMGGDATDDMMGDLGGDMGGMDDMGGEGAVEDRVADLEDALEQLKAEFEALMADEEGEEEHSDMFGGDEEGDEEGDDEAGDDEGDDEGEEAPEKEGYAFEAKKEAKKDDKKAKKSAGEEMREYVEKIGGGQYNQFGKMGDNGQNTKSIVAAKNDMGGTTANILRGDTEQGVEANKGQLKGSSLIKQKPQDMKTGNINVPGGKASSTWKNNPKGHGAEKKGAGETADKGAGSMLNGAPKRAK